MDARLNGAGRWAPIVVMALAVESAALFRIVGPAPSDIDTAVLTKEYHRIYTILAPAQSHDTSPITCIYYERKRWDGVYGLPEWGGGGAVGTDTIIVPLLAESFLSGNFHRITLHECIHIILARAYPHVRIPRWLHEGVAMMFSGEITLDEHVVISRAIFANALLPLSAIDSVNHFDRWKAHSAYIQSHLAVRCLVETYGQDAIAEILAESGERGFFWDGFRTSTGLTAAEFEALVRKYIIERYKLIFIIADTYLIWLAILGLAMAGFIVTRIRFHRRLAEMEASEEEHRESADGENAAQRGQGRDGP
jgi:hypothetical protein